MMPAESPRSVLLALSPALAERVLQVGAHLERFGFEVAIAATDTEVLSSCGRRRFDGVVFDLRLTSGLGLRTWLDKLELISPSTVPVAVAAVDEVETVRRELYRTGGDYVLLPLHLGELKARLSSAVAARRAQTGETTARPPAAAVGGLDSLVGASPQMERIRDRIRKVAVLDSTVLVTGESGVGKELIARAIHLTSPRREQPFIALNCSALPETLLESELFGHERGAFTGAAAAVKGKFELAHRGTLFLDEIGDMNPYTQAKILRAIEQKEFMRVGGDRTIRVDARLVAATNADLPKLMREGRFREDLYYRLKVLTLDVPPLRDRTGDVPVLARAFIDRFTRANGIPPVRVTDDALERLGGYAWPGNIRELNNTLENLIAILPGNVIDVEDLPEQVRNAGSDAGSQPASARPTAAANGAPTAADVPSLDDMERELIVRALRSVDGNRTHAARILKIGVRTLQRKIKRYQLD